MPGLPDAAEKEALKRKINSYGKTWHTWMAGMRDRQPDPLPYGPARLQWSFNHDGEVRAGMLADRDKRMSFSTADERKDRQDLVSLAKPQGGVDALAGLFPNATPVPGVSTMAIRLLVQSLRWESRTPSPNRQGADTAGPAGRRSGD
jgi:hypothetical protein